MTELLARRDLFDAGTFVADGVDACFGRLTTLDACRPCCTGNGLLRREPQDREQRRRSINLRAFVEDHYLGDESVQVADVSQAMLGGKRAEVFV
jgi:hypothetical protein